jgi:hypothetical protein
MKIRSNATLLGFVLAASAAGLYGQAPAAQQPTQDSETKPPSGTSSSDSPAAETETKPWARRFSFGARLRWWSAQPFDGKGIEVGDSKTDISHAYDTTSASGRWGIGPVVDMTLTSHIVIRAEAFFGHLQYTKVTQVYTGTPTDGTLDVTYTEHTSTGYWDFPLLLRYQGTPQQPTTSTSSTNSGPKIHFSFNPIFSHAFVEAGGIVRQLTTVRTGNDTLYSDNSTAYDEVPTRPDHSMAEGAVVGLGLRFVDDFNLKLMPEVRYILWSGPTFESQSTLSRTRQLEVGLSLIF